VATSAAALAVGLPGAVLTSAPLAQAAPAATVTTAVAAPCTVPADRVVPAARRVADTTPVRGADLAAVPTTPVRTPSSAVARAAITPAQLPPRVTIPVYVHVIKGTKKGERSPAGPKRVRRLIDILNKGFAGAQLTGSPRTRYAFRLKRIDYTKRESWYHAYLFGPRDKKAKQKLHRGGNSSLNLYLNGGGSRSNPVLGWSRFPWQYRSSPRLDGVSVNVAALPGGSARFYNLGDTVIHETGHWMGLFHTFQGGCSAPGDQVADTPAEATPSFYCNTTSDTCPNDPGLDPVHNFMDYSYDSCMNTFTPGQVARMDAAFARYRW
jgi:hypothetical protein